MILPSDLAGRTTHEAGYFEVAADRFARWLAERLGGERHCRMLRDAPLVELLKEIPKKENVNHPRRDLIIPLGDWCALLNNSINGTDVGVLPMRVAEKLQRRAIRAVSSEGYVYPATILDLFTPDSDNPLFYRRSIYAGNDGGRWSFDSSGDPFDFEEVERYSERRIRDRFTPEMLERYLMALGVPLLESANEPISGAILVEQAGE